MVKLDFICMGPTDLFGTGRERNIQNENMSPAGFEPSLPPHYEQVSGAHVNEIKNDHSPVVIVVLDPRYEKSYKALYIYGRI